MALLSFAKVEDYFSSLGALWWLYLIAAVGLFVCVVYWAFYCADNVETITNVENSKELFHTLAYLTIGTFVCTCIDFSLYEKGNRGRLRITPVQVLSGMLATFLGLALWTLDSEKKGKTMELVLFQISANSVMLAAIFNQAD